MAWFSRTLAAALCALVIGGGAVHAQTTIRAVMHSDIKIFDPIWSNANIARIHGYMVLDTLFAMDAAFKVQPQMVDTWSVSDDKLVYTFTLRDGLEWNDGTPVTSEDCIASIKRWAARDPMGQKLLELSRAFEVVDARSFRIALKEPFGLVLEALGKQAVPVPFIMPKRLAETDPYKQITEVAGSGPFVFSKDEWRPGERVVYVKNPRYKPRPEPASGLAGGKVVKVDRVEWLAISDPQTAFNALRAGEIDLMERVAADLIPTAEKTRDLALWAESATTQYLLRLNWLHAPFNNQKVRAAAAMALNQEDFLEVLNGNPRFSRPCKSVYPCGTPHASDAGTQGWLESNAARARQMLQEAGYDGTPVVFLQTTDIPITNNAGPVVKTLLERAGFRVQVLAMDWQTLSARLNKKEAPAEGGWNAYLAAPPGTDMVDPFINQNMLSTCGRARVGWPCDETMERLRDAYAREPDATRRQAIAAETQRHFLSVWTYIPLGEFFHVGAVRSAIDVPPRAAVPVFWGMARR
ncbi:MAG: ABC transporter substrate-binding protein [Alphaproteobacteria bacterium]|nr:ABC transporter substrate-binding protein [Alphaproteobacteria bacterium]